MNRSEAEFPDDTSPIDKEEGLNYRKYEKNKTYDEDKEPEFPDDTSNFEMEEVLIYRKDESKKTYDEGKEAEPLNEDDNNREEQLGYMNYKKTVRKFYDDGWENSYHTSSDVSMLVYVCGVS